MAGKFSDVWKNARPLTAEETKEREKERAERFAKSKKSVAQVEKMAEEKMAGATQPLFGNVKGDNNGR